MNGVTHIDIDGREGFKILLKNCATHGLILVFNVSRQAELNSLKPIVSNGNTGYRMPENILNFTEVLGYGVFSWDDDVSISSFPPEVTERMRKGPFILVSYKWLRGSANDFFILGPKKQTNQIKNLFQPKPHWEKSKSLPGHFFISLPANVFKIKDFLHYVFKENQV